MLIFVQVYRTIDKKFEIINRFWKYKREQRNKQKGSLKASEENCSWSQSAPKDKMLLKWWRHQKQVHQKRVHQKLKIT